MTPDLRDGVWTTLVSAPEVFSESHIERRYLTTVFQVVYVPLREIMERERLSENGSWQETKNVVHNPRTLATASLQ